MLQQDDGETKYLCLGYEPLRLFCEACSIEKECVMTVENKVERSLFDEVMVPCYNPMEMIQ